MIRSIKNFHFILKELLYMTKRVSLTEVRSVTDFATSYQWYVTVNKPNKMASYPNADQINLRCISSEVPVLNDQPLETSIRGHKVWQPGIHNYTQSITLTMAESVTMMIQKWIQSWREICWESLTGVHETKADVETTITLVRLNRQDKPIWNYHLVGCFLSEYTQDTLGTENALFRPTMKINYDYFTDNAGGQPASTGASSARV